MNHQDDISDLQLRIDELEMRLAFQEDTVQALNAQIANLQKDSEKHQQMLQLLYSQWREMQEAALDGAVVSVQEKPPHY